MAKQDAGRKEQALGFSVPPYRLDYENQRTDYGIGIIGLHWVMQIMHLPAYQAARYDVVTAAEINEDRIEETRRKGFDVGHITRDWHEVIENEDVEVVDCCFGAGEEKERLRMQVIEAAGEAGKHLMIHKPVATTIESAERMARAAEEAGIRLVVNQNCRYNPACYSVKQLLTPERMGRPGVIELQNYWQGGPLDLEDPMPAYLGHVIHHADLLRWWVDEPCVCVKSWAGMKTTMAIYEFEGGTVAYHMENHSGMEAHRTNFRVMAEGGSIRAQHNWNWHFPGPGEREFVEVFTERDEDPVRLDLPQHVYEPVWSDINPWEPLEGAWYDLAGPVAGMMGTMGSLMRGVENDCPPDNRIGGAIESLRMCLAAQLAAKTGKPVDPRDLPTG